jgi:hypothetical protein
MFPAVNCTWTNEEWPTKLMSSLPSRQQFSFSPLCVCIADSDFYLNNRDGLPRYDDFNLPTVTYSWKMICNSSYQNIIIFGILQ